MAGPLPEPNEHATQRLEMDVPVVRFDPVSKLRDADSIRVQRHRRGRLLARFVEHRRRAGRRHELSMTMGDLRAPKPPTRWGPESPQTPPIRWGPETTNRPHSAKHFMSAVLPILERHPYAEFLDK